MMIFQRLPVNYSHDRIDSVSGNRFYRSISVTEGIKMKTYNIENANRHIIKRMGEFSVLEYDRDLSIGSGNAMDAYFMSQMGMRRRQLVINMNGSNTAVIQAGAMQWMAGNVVATSGVKGVGDLLGKAIRGAVTKESAVKPEYRGAGILVLEPTYKHIILVDVSQWGSGITIEDGMFYACDGTVKQTVTARKTLSSAVLGNEGLFNLSLSGNGIAALESNVPEEELICVDLENDEIRIDGDMAVCWSTSLQFTVEKSTKSLIGSAVSGEGLVNVYRGTGRLLLSPVANTASWISATAPLRANAAK